MLPHFLLLATATASAAVSSVRGLRALWWVLPAGLLVGFAAIRFEVGADYYLYSQLFLRIDDNSLTRSLEMVPQEVGFVALMFMIRQFSADPQVLFAVCSLLAVLPTLAAIRRARVNPTFALFLFIALGFYPSSLNAVRQSISVSLLLLAQTFRRTNKPAWLLLTALSVLFHSSAVLAALVLFLVSLIQSRLFVTLTVTILVSANLYALSQMPFAVSILSSLNERYADYLDQGSGAGLGTLLMLIANTLLAILLILVNRERQDTETYARELRFYIAAFIVSIGVLVVSLSNLFAARLHPYFAVFVIFAIPMVVKGTRYEKLLTLLLCAFGLAYYAFHIINYNSVVPYRTIWE